MSDIPTTSKIWLKVGTSEKYLIASKYYPVWEAKDGKVEKDIAGIPYEDYVETNIKWVIETKLLKIGEGSLMTTDWFMNTFLAGIGTKQFKEDGGSYKSVVLEETKIPFNPEEYVLGFANLKFTLIESE